MKLADLLLQSALLTGRVTVLLVYGVLVLFLLQHGIRVETARRRARASDARSWGGALLTVAFGALSPLSAWCRWGSLAGLFPPAAPAVLGGIGAVVMLVALSFLLWSFALLGEAGHVLARVDEGSKLRVHGPYSLVRHPIYFALGLLFAGTALAGLSWIGLALAALWWPIAATAAS